ncbi:MAG TPA: hypothetical protein VE971_04470 [Candidatus Eisenbacteria bacterium]|nr:hypothetical protein [Candidatus Eisenbacteria bacterium]
MGVIWMNNTVIAFPLIVGILGILLSPMPTFAVSATTMTKPTSVGSLNVVLQPSPVPIVKGTQTNFKVNFDQKGTSTVQPHIDYDVTISNAAGKQLFNAVTLAGQSGPSLHTSDGIITIPYTFQQPGTYTIKVSVFGILFNPIKPEFAQFQVNVT